MYKKIGKLAVEEGWLSPSECEEILQEQKERREQGEDIADTLFGKIAQEQGLMQETDLLSLLRQQKKINLDVQFQELKAGGSGFAFSHYHVEKLLGTGGMGDVYFAKCLQTQRDIALKIVKFDKLSDRVRKRFLREIDLLSQVKHDNIVSIVDYGSFETIDYLAMSYIEGITFDNALREFSLSITQWLHKFTDLLYAIAKVHECGIIHRDLKPTNIMYSDHKLIVLDFGLGKAVQSETRLTGTAEMVGTPFYMAPEQTMPNQEHDERTDIWALGVLLYQILTKHLPFHHDDKGKLIKAICCESPLPLQNFTTEATDELQYICDKALTKKKEQRYTNVQEMISDLQQYLVSRTIPVTQYKNNQEIQGVWKQIFTAVKKDDADFTYKGAENNKAKIRECTLRTVTSNIEDDEPKTNSQETSKRLLEKYEVIKPTYDYEFIEEIARGGMGIIFKGYQTCLQRRIAIKKIIQNTNPHKLEKFIAEAMVTAYLDHPNIVPVYELGECKSGEPLLAMKLIEGIEWKRLLYPKNEQQRHKAQQYDLEAHLNILINVCNAVAYAHSKGIVHNDLKPSNVMVGEFGEVLVMDWGIAVSCRENNINKDYIVHKSAICSPMGTPSYMPYELAEGLGEDIGPWTDVYLLGGILYELLMRKLPHGNNAYIAIAAVTSGKLPEFDNSIANDLQKICHRAMAKKIDKRYQNAVEFREAIQSYLRHRESVLLAENANKVLNECLHAQSQPRSTLYSEFSRAVAGFEQAIDLWSDNSKAHTGRENARIMYADVALANEDFGLAEAQIAPLPSEKTHDLKRKISQAKQTRLQIQKTTQRLRFAISAATLFIIVGLVIGFILVNSAHKEIAAQEKRTLEKSNLAHLQLASISYKKAQQSQQILVKEIEKHQKENTPLYSQQIENLYDQCGVFAGNSLQMLQQIDFAPPQQQQRITLLQKRNEQILQLSLQRNNSLLMWNTTSALCNERITDICYTGDGMYIIASAKDGNIHMWYAMTGEYVRAFIGHTNEVTSIAMSDDGQYLVSGSHDKTIRLWNLAGEPLQIMRGHRQAINDVAVYKNYIVSGSGDGTVRLWNFAGKQLQVLKGHTKPVAAVAINNDGIFSTARDSTLRFWNFSGVTTKTLSLKQNVHSLALSVDGLLLACGTNKGEVQVWNTQSITRKWTLAGHKDAVNCVVFSATGRYIACGSQDATFTLWDMHSGQRVKTIREHTRGVKSLCYSPRGHVLLSVADDKTIRAWDSETLQQVSVTEQHTGQISAIACNTNYIASASHDKTIRLWNRQHGREYETVRGHSKKVHRIQFVADKLISCSYDHTIRIWDLNSKKQIAIFDCDAVPADIFARSTQQILACTAQNKKIRVWNVVTGKTICTLRGHNRKINVLHFSDDGKYVFSGSEDESVRVWDIEKAKQINLLAHTRGVTALAYSPHWIASSTQDKLITIWNAKTGEQIFTIKAHVKNSSMCFSKDGNYLAFASDDNAIRVWSCTQRRQVFVLQGHKDLVSALAFYDNKLFSGGADATIRCWNFISTDKQRIMNENPPLWFQNLAINKTFSQWLMADALQEKTGNIYQSHFTYKVTADMSIVQIKTQPQLWQSIIDVETSYPFSDPKAQTLNKSLHQAYLQENKSLVLKKDLQYLSSFTREDYLETSAKIYAWLGNGKLATKFAITPISKLRVKLLLDLFTPIKVENAVQDNFHVLNKQLWQAYISQTSVSLRDVYLLSHSQNIHHLNTVAAIYAWQQHADKAMFFSKKAIEDTFLRVQLNLLGLSPQKVETLLKTTHPQRYILLHIYNEKSVNTLSDVRKLYYNTAQPQLIWNIYNYVTFQMTEQQLLADAKKQGDAKYLCQVHCYLGLFFYAKKQLEKARHYLQKASELPILENELSSLALVKLRKEIAQEKQRFQKQYQLLSQIQKIADPNAKIHEMRKFLHALYREKFHITAAIKFKQKTHKLFVDLLQQKKQQMTILQEMENAFAQVQKNNDLSIQAQLLLWQKFQHKFHKENIYSQRDNKLRSKAQQYVRALQLAHSKKKWQQQLDEMQKRFALNTALGSLREQINSWQDFLRVYSENNPHTQQDEEMRSKAQQRLQFAIAQQQMWQPKLQQMQTHFLQSEKHKPFLQKQIVFWEQFLRKYSQDIPISQQDEKMRSVAQENIRDLQQQYSSNKQYKISLISTRSNVGMLKNALIVENFSVQTLAIEVEENVLIYYTNTDKLTTTRQRKLRYLLNFFRAYDIELKLKKLKVPNKEHEIKIKFY